MAEKFLILGGNSFYGKNFADVVKSHGDEINLFYRPQFDISKQKTWRWLEWAFSNPELKPDYVINFISQSLVAPSWERPEDWIKVNVLHTTELFQFLRKQQFKKYIHISTPEVYGSVDSWVTEEQGFNPSTPYAVTRAAGDLMLKAFHRAYGFPMCITRTSNIYGPGQPAHRIVPQAIKCKKEGRALMLEGSGVSVRNFIHVQDACEATYLVAKRGRVGETYHISGNVVMRIRELAEGIGCDWEPAPERFGKDYAYKLISSKIRTELGWGDRISLEEGLRQCESATLV